MLEVRGLEKSFGSQRAVAGATFGVGDGESVALIGPNGAGKTTVIDCICGAIQADAGDILVDGRELRKMPTWKRARLGVGRTFQKVELFADMSVRDHLIVALRVKSGGARLLRDLIGRSAPTESERTRVGEVLSALGLEDVASTPVSALDLGTCRLVELARAVVVRPKVLLADEPSSGLDEKETREVGSMLRALQRTSGMALLLVEHDLSLVSAVADRVLVMDLGALVASGTFADVMADPAVQRAYLGTRL